MKRVFHRIFKLGQVQAHSIVDSLEDPIKMSQNGIRDLKRDLGQSILSLAQAKVVALRLKKNVEDKKKLAHDYERRAMLILQEMQKGNLDQAEAERLASEALGKKEKAMQMAGTLQEDYTQQERTLAQLEAEVEKLKRKITRYEHELLTLEARARTAASMLKINQQLAGVDSSNTIAMLEKMKNMIMEEESLAEAYRKIAGLGTEVEEEIEKALQASTS